MSDYIKREDAVFIVLQQPMLSTSVVTEIRLLDGIDIVRCKECRWYDADTDWANIPYCDKHHIEAYEDGFCSYGERSE